MIFVGMRERTSGLIRGIQISSAMQNSQFVDAREISKLNSIRNQTVVFIRSIDTNLAQNLKNNGCIIGYDLLDRPVADHHSSFKSDANSKINWNNYNIPCVDFFIVNNSLYKANLEKSVSKPIFVIPHHHVNSEGVRNPVGRVKTVGYIGLADQLVDVDKIKETCSELGLSFFTSHPNTQEECKQDLSKIDIGIISLDGGGYKDSVLKYKPNTKLTNFQAYGIPTIASEYESFKEFGGEINKGWIPAKTTADILDNLKHICGNSQRMHQISDESISISKNFSLNNIISRFYSQLPGYQS